MTKKKYMEGKSAILNVVLIGLGKQGRKEYLPVILECNVLKLQAVCDSDPLIVEKVSVEHNVPGFTDLQELINANQVIDLAILCLPHSAYMSCIRLLALHKVNMFKEKPLAVAIEEVEEIDHLIKSNGVSLGVSVERRYDPLYQQFKCYLDMIGELESIEATYFITYGISGWRADARTSGGAALIDMGYHFVDLLFWYFDSLENPVLTAIWDVLHPGIDKFAKVEFSAKKLNQEARIPGILAVSATSNKKEERIFVKGYNGSALLDNSGIFLMNNDGNVLMKMLRPNKQTTRVPAQLEKFIDLISGKDAAVSCPTNYTEQKKHVEFICSAYKSAASKNINNSYLS